MADIRAFRGYRYDLGQVGTLSDVIAPPYDVIDPGLQQIGVLLARFAVDKPLEIIFRRLRQRGPAETDDQQ